jgi:DNA invertase Pin-like site-specific DNA recombinase
MTAAIYARKSTDQDLPDAEKSVTRQIVHATAYAARKGWTVDSAHGGSRGVSRIPRLKHHVGP